jgi:dihydrofolate synthase/folylpolyglutamate synthase
VENAATAYAAILAARRAGLADPDDAVRAGFAAVEWHGRVEVLRASPPVLIDSAHNRDSARRLRQALDDYLGDWPVVLLFGASEDKDIAGMFDELLPRAAQVICTQSVHPRAAQAEDLAQLAGRYRVSAQAVLPLEKALDVALEQAGGHSAVVAAGSLFVAGAVRAVWQKMNEKQETKHEI